MVEVAEADPAPRRPDGAPEVRRIPLSLQQPGPRERSCEKSCSDSKVFSALATSKHTAYLEADSHSFKMTKAFPDEHLE